MPVVEAPVPDNIVQTLEALHLVSVLLAVALLALQLVLVLQPMVLPMVLRC